MMLECNDAKENLISLQLTHLFFKLVIFLIQFFGLWNLEKRLCYFLERLAASLLLLKKNVNYIVLKLLSYRLVGKANCFILLIPLGQDGLNLSTHGPRDVLNLLPVPEVCAVIENDRCLPSTKALELLAIDVLHQRCQNVAKAGLSFSLLYLHQFEVHEDQRVILNVLSITRAVNFRRAQTVSQLIFSIQAIASAVVLLILSSVEGKVQAVFVNDLVALGIFFVLSNSLVSLNVPQLFVNLELLKTTLCVPNMSRQ